MRQIWDFIKRDARHLHGNVIALVVLVGIIVVPTFYAWFNIAGSWDPYGNTKNLKVAVANNDAGYSSDLLPVEVNLGERVIGDLRESDSIGYVFTNEDEAVEGVRSGEYYAALVIPEDFSRDLMGVLSENPTKPQVSFYQNEKANAIAAIVTDKASTAVRKDINESFAHAVTEVGTGVLDALGQVLEGDQLSSVASKLVLAMDTAAGQLTDAATDVRSFSALLGSTKDLLGNGTSTVSTSLSSTLDLGATLRDTADGIRGVGDALDGTTDSINDAIKAGSANLDSVSSAIDDAFSVAGSATDSLSDGLGRANDLVEWQIGELTKLSDSLAGTDTLYDTYEETWKQEFLGSTIQIDQIHETRVTIQGLNKRVQSALAELEELSSQIEKTQADLANGKSDAQTAKEQLKQLVADAKGGIGELQADYEANVRGSLSALAGQIESAASDAESIMAGIDSTVTAVEGASSSAAGSLGEASGSLDEAANKLDEAANKLSGLRERVSAAMNSGDLDQVKTLLSAGPDSLASFIATPVTVDRTAIYPIENNGSAMAPFYTTLAIWIGGVVLAALVKANPSERALEETGCGHNRGYLGRLAFFAIVGLLQATIICAGDLFFLGVQCDNIALFFLAGWVASFAFVNIIYALTASFGDVGKAVAVVLMVIQVAGSGGTFPREMLPAGFQLLYPFLPFVQSENAFRAAMFGQYNGDFWVCLAKLAAFVIPSLVLGLVLRRPVIRLNEWVEHKLESTKLM